MLQRLRQAGLIWPTLAALAGLAVLIGLGTWQLDRKRWKDELLAKIAERAHAEPISLLSLLDEAEASIREDVSARKGMFAVMASLEDIEYRHVFIRGRFHHDKEQFVYAPSAKGPGWHVYTPLQTAGDRWIVWINRGFVPYANKPAATRPEGQVAGEVEVRGLVRFPIGKGLFTPQNDVQHNLWYWPDIAAMTAAAFPEGPQSASGRPAQPAVLRLVIEANTQPEAPGGLPRGGVTRLDLPNRHLEYAVTWYGLALTLIGVYLAFAVNRLRASRDD
jgi:surfeit locus 1 family protein